MPSVHTSRQGSACSAEADRRATLIADGMVIVRHPELPQATEMAHRFAADLHLFAS